MFTNQDSSWKIRHKILWDFEIQTDHLIPARKPDQEIISKKKKREKKEGIWRLEDFVIPQRTTEGKSKKLKG